MKSSFFFLIIIVIIFSISTCWKKQENEILAPDTPVYTVSGQIVDSMTREPVDGVTVTIVGTVTYIGKDTSTTFSAIDTTASDGFYTFHEVPGGFAYNIVSQKDGYESNIHPIVMYYEDREITNIILGKILFEDISLTFNEYTITGITSINGIIWFSTTDKQVVQLASDYSIQSMATIDSFYPITLTWDGSSFWASDSIIDTVHQFRIAESGDVEYLNWYSVPMDLYHPEIPVDLIDMSWDNGEIWGCSLAISRKYCHFDPIDTASTLTYFPGPEELYYPVGIDIESNKIYLAGHFDTNHRLYILEKSTNDILGYGIFVENVGSIAWDGSGVWMADGNKITKYKF